MSTQIALTYSVPHRLPLGAVVAAAALAVLLLGSALFPQDSTTPQIGWRGNAGNIEALR
ncbi:hypothetical protein KM176_07140 [Pseudooceanicola sp. CBS1P-1]|uniref:Uncharacterized protein n=1 Tax=Pseudooceanicola albus TaxID=2692189 RepID=A0A6L7G067_9RHOB|nr:MULTISPECIES: hypothetical protein [Pseudooceanicola]MBT9383626.1 hypothetical protein [Pseudooceanicola endophyticus]MXN17481.1 hypothetical protein [Pseudooceanicola albus]